jgi:magnesium-transporting ATPase (P-type)
MQNKYTNLQSFYFYDIMILICYILVTGGIFNFVTFYWKYCYSNYIWNLSLLIISILSIFIAFASYYRHFPFMKQGNLKGEKFRFFMDFVILKLNEAENNLHYYCKHF